MENKLPHRVRLSHLSDYIHMVVVLIDCLLYLVLKIEYLYLPLIENSLRYTRYDRKYMVQFEVFAWTTDLKVQCAGFTEALMAEMEYKLNLYVFFDV